MVDSLNTLLISLSRLIFALSLTAMDKVPLPGTKYAARTIRRIAQYHPRENEKANMQIGQFDELRACLVSSFSAFGCNTGEDDEHDQHFQQTPVPRNTPNMTPSPSFRQDIRAHVTNDEPSPGVGRETEVDLSTQSSFLFGDDSSSDVGLFYSSTLSDNSEDGSVDPSSFFAQPVTPEKSSATTSRPIGLGISSITRKDGSAPFDGLGLVSIKASPWKTSSPLTLTPQDKGGHPHEELSLPPPVFEVEGFSTSTSDSADSLSRTLLQEALLTFHDDPFHSHTLHPIPECSSWYGIDQHTTITTIESETEIYPFHNRPLCTSSPRMKRNFTSPTISSAFKRSSSSTVSPLPRARSGHGDGRARSRSSSLPTSSGGAPKPAWRL